MRDTTGSWLVAWGIIWAVCVCVGGDFVLLFLFILLGDVRVFLMFLWPLSTSLSTTAFTSLTTTWVVVLNFFLSCQTHHVTVQGPWLVVGGAGRGGGVWPGLPVCGRRGQQWHRTWSVCYSVISGTLIRSCSFTALFSGTSLMKLKLYLKMGHSCTL